ncbi:MAG: chemotaxis protein CheC [Candidatus Omnitrophica bacterium]|nr:chemotaxis protein CheC [Candidatus Omnitrophota bacterium]
MQNSENMRTEQLDLLRKIGEVGSKRAAEALSGMISVEVEVNASDIDVVFKNKFYDAVPSLKTACFVLVIELEGNLGGKILFLMSANEAKLLGAALLGMEEADIDLQDSMFHSSLKEALNVIAGAYMAVLSEVTGLEIMFSVPHLEFNSSETQLTESGKVDGSETMLIKTALKIQTRNFDGLFLFFPDEPTVNTICAAIGKTHIG